MVWGDCFAVLIQNEQHVLTCRHEARVVHSESAVNSNVFRKFWSKKFLNPVDLFRFFCYTNSRYDIQHGQTGRLNA